MPTPDCVEVPALCEFTHEGRSYVRGELVRVAPVVALALARKRKVSLARENVRGGRYLRRDLRAEDER